MCQPWSLPSCPSSLLRPSQRPLFAGVPECESQALRNGLTLVQLVKAIFNLLHALVACSPDGLHLGVVLVLLRPETIGFAISLAGGGGLLPRRLLPALVVP